MTVPARVTQIEMTRGMRAARAAGFSSVRVTIDQSGNMVIDASDAPIEKDARKPSPLDRFLTRP